MTKTMLTEGAREALRGDRLISQEGDTPLTFTPHAPKSNVDGQIIAVADDATQIGQYQVVVLNRGAHGTALRRARCWPSTRRGEVVQDVWNRRPSVDEGSAFGPIVQLPYERAGTLIVFKVFDRVSYGL